MCLTSHLTILTFQLTLWCEDKRIRVHVPLVQIFLDLLFAVPPVNQHSPIIQGHHATRRPRRRWRSTGTQFCPLIILCVKTVDVVKVLIIPQIIVKAAEYDKIFLHVHHPVTAPGAGSVGCLNFFPLFCGHVVNPQISVVVELRLRGTGEFAAKQPQLAFVGRSRDHLVATAGGRPRGGFHNSPRVGWDVVEKKVVV
jgi:hypothetical protein